MGDLKAVSERPAGAYASLKGAYRFARHLPDRVLHRHRHSEALRRVARLFPVRSILVVCHGNICRSPYLQATLQRTLPSAMISSAGFGPPGQSVPPHALSAAIQRGMDLSEFRSRPVSRANADRFDLVIVMDAEQARQMSRLFRVSPARILIAGDLDPFVGATRSIRDPWGQSPEVFKQSFDRLERCAATLIRQLRR